MTVCVSGYVSAMASTRTVCVSGYVMAVLSVVVSCCYAAGWITVCASEKRRR